METEHGGEAVCIHSAQSKDVFICKHQAVFLKRVLLHASFETNIEVLSFQYYSNAVQ